MTEKKSSFVNVDQIVDRADLGQVMAFYGYPLPQQRSGSNLRMLCPIDDCEETSYGKLSISERPPYFIHCHSCGVRGKLLELMWIMKHHRAPAGGKVRSDEFKEVRDDLVRIVDGDPPATTPLPDHSVGEQPTRKDQEIEPNTPLSSSENERVRATANLHERGTTDIAEMPPAASRYFRERPFLTPEVCAKWNVAYLPMGHGTLQGRVIYGINNERGERLAYAGRLPDYEKKHAQWLQDRQGKEPIKHRFPSEKFFRRGLELFGQESRRLRQPGYREAIRELGIIVVEGFNDVIALDALGQPAVGLMSNRITQQQLEKLVRWAGQLSDGKVTVMFDSDEHGIEGARETVYKLSQLTAVQSVELPTGRQPESLSLAEWQQIRRDLSQRWKGNG